MPKIFSCLLFFLLLSAPSSSFPSDEQAKPDVIYFYSSHCVECAYLKEEFFPTLEKKYTGRVAWKEVNIDESPENLDLAVRLVLGQRKFGTLTPSLVIGETVLMGRRGIESGFEKAVELAISSPQAAIPEYPSRPERSFSERFSLPIIMAGGLIDGVNPCAFAAIALLISIMYVRSYGKKKVIAVSLSYCAAVFITYFMIGLGAFGFLYSIKDFYRAAMLFRYAVGGVCFILAAASLYDFLLYKRTGRAEGLILALPSSIKKKISLTIGSNLRGGSDEKRSIFAVSLGAFSAGVLVSCMEMICTGQVYLPALVYIMKSSEQKFAAFSYIFLYNLMFIVPLILVSGLYIMGVRSEAFGSFLKKHAGSLKIALAAVFMALGLVILFQR